MRCKKCSFLERGEDLSLISRLIGYTAKCSKSGILFILEEMTATPDWCPLESEKKARKQSIVPPAL